MPKFEAKSPNLLRNSHFTPKQGKFSPSFPQKLLKSLLSLYFSVTSIGEAPLLAQSAHRTHLFFGDHVISQDTDVANLYFDGVTRDHVAVSSLGAHPEHVARVESRVPAQLLNPGRCIPDLVG